MLVAGAPKDHPLGQYRYANVQKGVSTEAGERESGIASTFTGADTAEQLLFAAMISDSHIRCTISLSELVDLSLQM